MNKCQAYFKWQWINWIFVYNSMNKAKKIEFQIVKWESCVWCVCTPGSLIYGILNLWLNKFIYIRKPKHNDGSGVCSYLKWRAVWRTNMS